MHVQPVDPHCDLVTCPECGVIQNIDVAKHDEETDLLAGQRCWYCGTELRADELAHDSEFKVVLSGHDVPISKDAITLWAHDLAQQFGGKLVDFIFDGAGRCVVTLHAVKTADDLDIPVE